MTDIPEQSLDAPTTEALQHQLAVANSRLIHAEMKAHAIQAGIIDLDGLKLLDQSALKLDAEGNIAGAAGLMDQLKRDTPWLFTKPNSSHPAPPPTPEPAKPRMAKDMTYREWQLARERLLRGR